MTEQQKNGIRGCGCLVYVLLFFAVAIMIGLEHLDDFWINVTIIGGVALVVIYIITYRPEKNEEKEEKEVDRKEDLEKYSFEDEKIFVESYGVKMVYEEDFRQYIPTKHFVKKRSEASLVLSVRWYYSKAQDYKLAYGSNQVASISYVPCCHIQLINGLAKYSGDKEKNQMLLVDEEKDNILEEKRFYGEEKVKTSFYGSERIPKAFLGSFSMSHVYLYLFDLMYRYDITDQVVYDKALSFSKESEAVRYSQLNALLVELGDDTIEDEYKIGNINFDEKQPKDMLNEMLLYNDQILGEAPYSIFLKNDVSVEKRKKGTWRKFWVLFGMVSVMPFIMEAVLNMFGVYINSHNRLSFWIYVGVFLFVGMFVMIIELVDININSRLSYNVGYYDRESFHKEVEDVFIGKTFKVIQGSNKSYITFKQVNRDGKVIELVYGNKAALGFKKCSTKIAIDEYTANIVQDGAYWPIIKKGFDSMVSTRIGILFSNHTDLMEKINHSDFQDIQSLTKYYKNLETTSLSYMILGQKMMDVYDWNRFDLSQSLSIQSCFSKAIQRNKEDRLLLLEHINYMDQSQNQIWYKINKYTM